MNYGRWLVVLLLAVSMGVAVSILIIPGERYQTLTTSDSGWNYNVALQIDNRNSLTDNAPLSHAPAGQKVEPEQLQPLTTTMLYRAANAVNPSVTLMDVVKYWSPLMFALALIPIFLIGRELGGNTAGIVAAFLTATLVGSIYWNKVGAYDREAMQTLLGAWTMYCFIKLFKAPRQDLPKFSLPAGITAFRCFFLKLRYYLRVFVQLFFQPFALLAGLTGGLFALAWAGWLFTIAVLALGVVLVLALGFLGKLTHGRFDIVNSASSAIKSHLHLLAGVIGMLVVVTVVIWTIEGSNPIIVWSGFAQTILGYAGINIGGGWVSFPRYASEAQLAGGWGDTFGGFYTYETLTLLVIIFMALGVMKLLWTRKKHELLVLAWFVVLLFMVWPGKGTARFDRMWWPLLTCLAGVGLAWVVSLAKKYPLWVFLGGTGLAGMLSVQGWLGGRLVLQFPLLLGLAGVGLVGVVVLYSVKNSSEELSDELSGHIHHFLLPVLAVVLVSSAFVANAGAAAAATTPPTEWRGFRGIDSGFMEAFSWIDNNTSSDSIFSIQWSFGHLFTGAAQRPAVTDGSETPGQTGVWESDTSIPHPPDYVYYVTPDGQGEMYGINVPREPFFVNGRRTDVQAFPLMGMNELKWYLKTYRDSYGVEINYLIFSYDEYYNAVYHYQTSDFGYQYLWPAERRLTSTIKGPTTQGGNYVFSFGGDRSAVIYDRENVYVVDTANGRHDLDGYGVFTIDSDGKISFQGFAPSAYPPENNDYNQALVIVLDYNGSPIGSWLAKGTYYPDAPPATPDSYPYGGITRTDGRVGIGAFNTDTGSSIGGDNALQVVFTSSNRLVKIIQVNHQFIT